MSVEGAAIQLQTLGSISKSYLTWEECQHSLTAASPGQSPTFAPGTRSFYLLKTIHSLGFPMTCPGDRVGNFEPDSRKLNLKGTRFLSGDD